MIWFVFGALTLAVLAPLVVAMLRATPSPTDRAERGMEVYRRQMRELEGDLARGQIVSEEAEAMRVEFGRRLLAADAAREDPGAASPGWRIAGALGIGVAVPVIAFALYAVLGSPGLPDLPLVARQTSASTQTAGLDFESVTARLAARLEKAPDDPAGWALLGRSYNRLGRYRDARDAFERARALDDGNAELHAAYGETLIFVSEGVVTPAARRAFLDALDRDPRHPGARFYLGLAERQAGDSRAAYERWLALVREGPSDAPWIAFVTEHLRDIARELDVDLAEALPAQAPTLSTPSAPRGPSADQMAAAAAMSDEERSTMIRGMVEGLAARLEDRPDDLDGWLRLGRVYGVLGEPAKARDAYARAINIAPDNISALLSHGAMAVEANGTEGPLPPEAVASFERVLELDPGNDDASWFVGLAAARDGDSAKAARIWRALLARLDPRDPRAATLRTQLETIAGGG